MADQIIALDNSPNQSFQVTVNVNGSLIKLALTLGYNAMAGYWVMSISGLSGNLLLDSIPLVTGNWPAANLLAQFQYLGIGSVYVLNVSGPLSIDYPDNTDLGSDFQLLWGDAA